MELVLEINGKFEDKQPVYGIGERKILVTPPIGEDYWLFRVKLSDDGQAIVGFPKFFTIGIGFAREKDWNTNLPYTQTAERIFEHIKHNKGAEDISDEDCLQAIRLVKEAAGQFIELGEKKHAHTEAN